MKYIIIRDGETIKHIEPIGHDFSVGDVLVLDAMPEFFPQEGKVATLKYSDADGVHYEYSDAPEHTKTTEEIYAEALNMLGVETEEVLNDAE